MMAPYGDSAGYLPLRKAIASYLSATRGVRCAAEHVIITSGSLHALEIIARVIPVPLDADGLNVASGVSRCADPRLIYVTPSHQYPLGITLSLSRRLELLRFAGNTSAWIVELSCARGLLGYTGYTPGEIRRALRQLAKSCKSWNPVKVFNKISRCTGLTRCS